MYLGGYEGKAGGDSSLEDTEQEPNGDGTGEVMHNSEEGEDEAPCDDTEGRVLGQRQSLQQDGGRILPRQVSYDSQLSPLSTRQYITGITYRSRTCCRAIGNCP